MSDTSFYGFMRMWKPFRHYFEESGTLKRYPSAQLRKTCNKHVNGARYWYNGYLFSLPKTHPLPYIYQKHGTQNHTRFVDICESPVVPHVTFTGCECLCWWWKTECTEVIEEKPWISGDILARLGMFQQSYLTDCSSLRVASICPEPPPVMWTRSTTKYSVLWEERLIPVNSRHVENIFLHALSANHQTKKLSVDSPISTRSHVEWMNNRITGWAKPHRSCLSNGLGCTDLCKLQNCTNQVPE